VVRPTAEDRLAKKTAISVAALLQAGAAAIAERGYEAATMAEVAARAGAPIGSLYRFFPNKEVLADTLMQRFGGVIDDAFAAIDDAFAAIDARAGAMSMAELADALLALVGKLRGEMPAIVSLLDVRFDWSAKRSEFRIAVRTHIARTLMLCSPHLDAELAGDIATVLLNVMKTMARMTRESGGEIGSGATTELPEMTRLYLENRFAKPL
jgi:AcrR family transcriptional regulator